MNIFSAVARFSQKESLEQLRDFHKALIKWIDYATRIAEELGVDEPDPDAFYHVAIKYVEFLRELGVLDGLED